MSISSIDLSNYVLVGRYDLPEPTRTPAPPNSLLAQEADTVIYLDASMDADHSITLQGVAANNVHASDFFLL